MTTIATSATHTTITEPNHNPEASIRSIRKICMEGILAGRGTKEIAAEIAAHHPTSAAAAKSGKHIAWYRSYMKKEGLLPTPE